MTDQRFSALNRISAILALITAIFAVTNFSQPLFAQESTLPRTTAPHPLITQPIDEARLTLLQGNTHPLARPEFDLGTAPASLSLQRMLLVLKRSPDQESALGTLLDDQQNQSSPNYHQWLTPTAFGQQFGPTDTDIQTVTAWLQSHGFQIGATKGRTVLEFSGSAGQVQEAFHTTIHKYVVNGEQHWANSTDPSIPTALAPAVAGVAALNNFSRKAMNVSAGRFTRDKSTGKIRPLTPLFTYQPNFQCSADSYCFAVGPYDFATIYNVLPLWNTNINGTGQTIAIVGESNINPQDVADFRSLFGLPANSSATGNPLNIILNGPDPGPQSDESEADIDVQWSGAVAPYATIDFVVSQSTETTSGVDLSAVYVVDNNLAPVMSESYGFCELGLGTSGNQFYNALWQQAAAQGITVFISSGDNGAAGCDDFNANPPSPAQFGLAVSGYASTPYNVAVGGTDFNEFTSPTTYWNVNNNSTTQASALGYIPETTWNDSCTNSNLSVFGFSTDAETNCNNSQLAGTVITEGGSGGASACTTPSGSQPQNCSGGYSKPSWQTGTGVPNDGKRDLPDVSLFASNGFAGTFYIVCQSDQTGGPCNLDSEQFLGFGGTSVSSPAFAGIMALVNQKTGARQGNANYVFYKLAAKQSAASCNSSTGPASTCVFNDVTSGTNAMPCAEGSTNCNTSSGDFYGVLSGNNTTAGYDLATGLGSVNANNLVNQWSSITFLPSTTTLNSLTPTTVTHGQAVTFNATVAPQSGTAKPTGQISLIAGTGSGIGAFNLSNGTASGTTSLLPGGTYSVTAHYSGDGTYAASDSNPISVTVGKENSGVQTFLVTFNSSGQIVSSDTTTAIYGSPYIFRSNVVNASGQPCSPTGGSSSTGCPTGSVTVTDNGSPLDAGTFTLNSFGYFEDVSVQLPGGTNSINASYPGDNSFNSTSATASIGITPATTTMTTVGGFAGSAGLSFQLITTVNTTSSGAGPTGTVVFLANGSPLSGTVVLTPSAASGGNPASAYATLITAINIPGTYTFGATYSGDANYSASTAPVTAPILLQYLPPGIGFQANPSSIAAGSNVTITAEIIASTSVTPTGTISFTSLAGPITGTVTYSTVVNANTGLTDLVGTITYAPTFSDSVTIQYGGDANYPSSSTSGGVTVTGTDFTISIPQASLTLNPGQSGELNMLVGLQAGASPVTFSCTGLPANASCNVDPSSVATSLITSLNIFTAASSAQLARPTKEQYAMLWTVSLPLFGGVLLLFAPRSRSRKWKATLMFLMLFSLALLPSCGGSPNNGGGGGGGGGGNSGTPAGSYPITVTGTSGSVSHTATFTLIVQ